MGPDSRRRRAGKFLLKSPRWFVEKLNLKTDHTLKGAICKLSHAELLSKKGSAIRSTSSAVTGIVLNSVIGAACPPFVAAAAVNAWQLCVSATNCDRIRQEIKRRAAKDDAFNNEHQRHRKRHNFRDAVTGATIKTTFCAVGAGIVGIDHIADNFVELGHHAATAVASQHVGDGLSNTGVDHSHSPNGTKGGLAHHDRAAEFTAKHAHLAAVDKGMHRVFGGVGETAANKMGAATGIHVNDQTSWQGLKDFAHGSTKIGAKEAAVVGVVGVGQELTQFAAQAGEIGYDKYRQCRERGKVKHRLAGYGMNMR